KYFFAPVRESQPLAEARETSGGNSARNDKTALLSALRGTCAEAISSEEFSGSGSSVLDFRFPSDIF
ncbi:MAG: hypothetical protein KAR36_09765, partial [Candidatus Latescibacteria bacterium]|nr:hypothetical protein [Candidatus Latescibacterota bacterium]